MKSNMESNIVGNMGLHHHCSSIWRISKLPLLYILITFSRRPFTGIVVNGQYFYFCS